MSMKQKSSCANNAEWISQFYVRVYNSQHYEDWDPRFLENYDIDEYLKYWEYLDPDVVVTTARTHNGKWFCDVGLGSQHKGLKGVDQLAAVSQYARSKGKPVVAYFSTIYDKVLYDEHPEWRQIDPDGNPVSNLYTHSGRVLCPNSPYKEHLIAMVQHLFATHDLDGILYDMVFFEDNPCYCRSCRKLFQSKYGTDIPLTEDWNDPAWRKFIQFRFDTNYLFVREICDAVKQIDSKLATYVQYILMKHGGNLSGQTVAIGAAADYIYSDVYFGRGYVMMSVETKLKAVISRYTPEMGIMVRPGTHDDTPNMKPLAHLRSEAFTILANGGAVHFFDIMWADGTLQTAMRDRIKIVSADIRARVPWLGGEPITSVGVFYSENTRFRYGQNAVRERYDMNFFGVCRTLMEEHIPFNILTSLDDPSLGNYQVLVLPNTVCLSDAEADAVRRFVKAGGGLVCTEKTSLWNERAEVREDYALADVLGVSHLSDTAPYSRVYSRYDTSKAPAKRLPADGLMSSWGAVQKVELKGAEALANIAYPYTEPTETRFVNIMANPPAVESDWPACTVHTYGEGRVIYFAGAIDKDYLKLSFQELKWLIADAVREVSKAPLSVELNAPMSVEITVFTRNEGTQLIVHLVNFQPEVGKNFVDMENVGKGSSGMVTTSRQLIQEILPVYNLELLLRDARLVKNVVLQPEGQTLTFDQQDGEIRVKIPKLECHSMVVIDF